MFKEIHIFRPVKRGQHRHSIVAVDQLSTVITDDVAASFPFLIGQDTWSDESRDRLVDYDLWLDIDAKAKNKQKPLKNIQATLPLCRAVLKSLSSEYGVSADQIAIYFSGNGGFHFLLPFKSDGKISSESLRSGVVEFCSKLEAAAPPDTLKSALLDRGLYCQNHLIRAPWSLHPSGLRKVPLSPAEIELPPTKLMQLIFERSRSYKAPMDWEWLGSKNVNAKFSETVARLSEQSVPYEKAVFDSDAVQMIESLKVDVRCMAWFARIPNQAKYPDHNKPKMFLLSMLKTSGTPANLAEEAAIDFMSRLSERDGSPNEKLQERISLTRDAAKSIHRSTTDQYQITVGGRCSTLLPGATAKRNAVACYCLRCLHYNADFKPHKIYRVTLDWLLKQKLSNDALRVYLELAVNGEAPSKLVLGERTCLNSYTLTKAMDELIPKGLIQETIQHPNHVISALRPVRKSIPLIIRGMDSGKE
jgi:hypothetical protein